MTSGGMTLYTLVFSREAATTLRTIHGKTNRKKVAKRLKALKVVPHIGTTYDPSYDAAVPRHTLRVTYAGNYGIYYTVDETRRKVNFEYLEDQRGNPSNRFGGFPPPLEQ